MSYYQTDYFRNPPLAYEGRSASRTVPGWGVSPRAAGPARIGVGVTLTPEDVAKLRQRVAKADLPPPEDTAPPIVEEGFKVPWWIWVAAPAAVAGSLALAVNMGWIGSEA